MPALARLIESGRAPVAVLTQADRPAGRGRRVAPGPVKQLAEAHAIPVLQPETLREPQTIESISALKPDLMVVAAYGLILPAAVLEIPRLGCWNIHASLLPRWRGAAPIQRAIEAGDRETGVSIMQMDEGLDTGAVLYHKAVTIAPDDTAATLHDRLARAGAEALMHCLDLLASGTPPEPKPQSDEGVSHARKIDKSEAEVDWSQSAPTIERRIRAFNPWPVAWCRIGGERTRVWKAEVTGQRCIGRPGDVLAAGPEGIDVASGDGVLRLKELQRPGGRRITVRDYLNARPRLPASLDPAGG